MKQKTKTMFRSLQEMGTAFNDAVKGNEWLNFLQGNGHRDETVFRHLPDAVQLEMKTRFLKLKNNNNGQK